MHPSFTPAHRGGSGPPLVLLHGFLDTWRTWELCLGALERKHAVFAPTLPGHAGGLPLTDPVTMERLVDQVEAMLDLAGIGVAQVVGNSLGGYLALRLAERGRASSVIALAPAGGWGGAELSDDRILARQLTMHEHLAAAGQRAADLVERPNGRRAATALITNHFEHIPAELIAHQVLGVGAASGAPQLIAAMRAEVFAVDVAQISCPLRFVWGGADKVLSWPAAAEGYRAAFSAADWVLLDDVGHAIQLDAPEATARLILEFEG